MEIKNYIYVDEWEISFMQDDGPMTVCVIRHLKKLDQRCFRQVEFQLPQFHIIPLILREVHRQYFCVLPLWS